MRESTIRERERERRRSVFKIVREQDRSFLWRTWAAREGDWSGSWSIKLNSAFSFTRACCEAVVDGGYSFRIWFLRQKAVVLRERERDRHTYHKALRLVPHFTESNWWNHKASKGERAEKRSYGEKENIWFTWLVLLSKLSEIQSYLFSFLFFPMDFFFLCQQNFENIYIYIYIFFFFCLGP